MRVYSSRRRGRLRFSCRETHGDPMYELGGGGMRPHGYHLLRPLLVLMLLALPVVTACGGQAAPEAGAGTGGARASIVPLEGWALSGQDRALAAGQPSFLAFDAHG